MDRKYLMIKKAWQDQKEIKNIMIFLQANGVAKRLKQIMFGECEKGG